MDDINVMSSLLEQQSGTVASFRTPVAEIATSVIDEMAYPDRLNFSDDTGVNDFLQAGMLAAP